MDFGYVSYNAAECDKVGWREVEAVSQTRHLSAVNSVVSEADDTARECRCLVHENTGRF